MSENSEFKQLAPALQKWFYKKGWNDLLPIQKASLRPILEKKKDIIISASTASGKTEAAFLPALTAVSNEQKKGIRILYISPLKALINDQFRRVSELAAELSIKVTPWHGDISANRKIKILEHPEGIILTTPESLESLLINHVSWLMESMSGLDYVVIDEFHVFMGSQRGYQLQSQLHRIDNLAKHKVVRIALSATFSDASAVISYLRPNSKSNAMLITDPGNKKDILSVQLRGYNLNQDSKEQDESVNTQQNYNNIAHDIFRLLRGSTNLVFCNSRSETESIATTLQKLSAQRFVPNEFFPHHGSLSKELRESLEKRLQEARLPTTAICTATLELGIDISGVQSIGQIDPPTSVSSLRQRLGRSGRRDHSAVLRLFIPEFTGTRPSFSDEFSENTVLSVAMINLLLKRWYEPPQENEYAFSTLLQQTLSVIASFGSVSAQTLWELLCKTGPFSLCTPVIFARFLRDLGSNDLIVQLNDKSLTLGLEGEKVVSRWSFYAAFKTPDEYTIEYDHKKIGTVPLSSPLDIDFPFLFAGKGWKVVFFSQERKLIGVKPYLHEASPLTLNGSIGNIHDEIRREMLRIYKEGVPPPYLNKTAAENCSRGFEMFRLYHLDKNHLIDGPAGMYLFPWRGDKVMITIILLLKMHSIKASQWKSHIELDYTSKDSLKEAIRNILRQMDLKETDLVAKMQELNLDKYDTYISLELKKLSYAHSSLDLPGALEFFRELGKELSV